jgi:AcrR family transcriptional regulator
MKKGQKTDKSERSREHILDTALALFAQKGYDATTMRDIAHAAEVSLGLAYRYFGSKEELVLTFYGRLAVELETKMQEKADGTLAERFQFAIRAKLSLLTNHRNILGALYSAALNPDSGVAVLGTTTQNVRQNVRQVFVQVVTGADDAPPEGKTEQLATLLYTTHLALVLFWLHDKSAGYEATLQLLAILTKGFGLLTPLLNSGLLDNDFQKLASLIDTNFIKISSS